MAYELTTDSVTASMIGTLHAGAASRLARFLSRAAEQTSRDPALEIVFQPIDFPEGSGVARMCIGCRADGAFRALATTEMADGTRWRDGGLTIPKARLPESTLAASAGRRVDEVVAGSSLGGLTVRSARNAAGGVILTCVADGAVLAVPGNPGGQEDERLGRAARLAPDLRCDPVACRVVMAMARREALHAMAWLGDAGPGDLLETDLTWIELTEGEAGERLAAELPRRPREVDGRFALEVVKGTVHVRAIMGGTADGGAWLEIRKGKLHSASDRGHMPRPIDALGFDLPGIGALKRIGRDAETIYDLKPLGRMKIALGIG